jgi:DNA-binding PadR family transcriptional regulator
MTVAPELLPGEWAVLGLVAEQPTHGYAAAQALAPDGELGQVWSLSRPLVYRSLGKLADAGLVEPAGTESAGGPQRELMTCTEAGRAALQRWLAEPVQHLRDARTVLMLKLAFLQRAGRSPERLLTAQRATFGPIIAALEQRVEEAEGFELTVARFRYETARGVDRFLLSALEG